jgi:hypothetical protein
MLRRMAAPTRGGGDPFAAHGLWTRSGDGWGRLRKMRSEAGAYADDRACKSEPPEPNVFTQKTPKDDPRGERKESNERDFEPAYHRTESYLDSGVQEKQNSMLFYRISRPAKARRALEQHLSHRLRALSRDGHTHAASLGANAYAHKNTRLALPFELLDMRGVDEPVSVHPRKCPAERSLDRCE